MTGIAFEISSGTNTTDRTGSGGSASGSNQNPDPTKTGNTANSSEKRLTDEQVKQLTDSANAAKTKRGRPTS